MDVDTEQSVDEELYSRQLYVLGHVAMAKLSTSKILIVGAKGLAQEIAKNLILAGVSSVSIHDDNLTCIQDLGAGFYLKPEHVGKPRAPSVVADLSELNRYVSVRAVTGVDADVESGYTCVVLTDTELSSQLDYSSRCRAAGVQYVVADVFGVCASLFVDLGPKFDVTDVDGEPPLKGMICSITSEGMVTTHDEHRHGLSDGDKVTFEEVEGASINSCTFTVRVTGPYTFSIGDISEFGSYVGGGWFIQVKQGTTVNFTPLKESVADPRIVDTDFGKLGSGIKIHGLYLGMSEFILSQGYKPRPDSAEDTVQLVECARTAVSKYMGASKVEETVDSGFILEVGRCCSAEISPMAAFLGGVAAQEVLKGATAKFMPFRERVYFDAREVLPKVESYSEFSPLNSRYDSQVAVIGRALHDKVINSKMFLVGSGAIGCEMLKSWAMMGVATAGVGEIVVADMDTIETSNLNRQFLFRPKDVGSLKATTAAKASIVMNPDMNIRAEADRIGADTEDIYDDSFWESRTAICTALDNVDARLYVDQRCVYFQKPLLESGTLGTKGNTQVVVPFLTESYGSTRDPTEEGIPVCTLKNFPNKIEHTIQWARDYFEGAFCQASSDVNAYLADSSSYLRDLEKTPSQQLATLCILEKLLVTDRPMTFYDCVAWARNVFEQEFNHCMKQLLHSFPLDTRTASGGPFWSGPKRAPSPLTFQASDETCLLFVTAAANLRAHMYGLPGSSETSSIVAMLSDISVPEFKVDIGKRIPATDAEMKEKDDMIPVDFDVQVGDVISKIPSSGSLAGWSLRDMDFEKDDDSNWHMDFITSCSNLRARCYRIKEVSKHETKGIAGKIIPAIATTTALVSGLVCLEFYKLLARAPLEAYKCAFVNLALPFISLAEPRAPETKVTKIACKDSKWSLWDRINVDVGRDITLQQFIDQVQEQTGLEINMLSYGTSMLFSFFGNRKKQKLRLSMPYVCILY